MSEPVLELTTDHEYVPSAEPVPVRPLTVTTVICAYTEERWDSLLAAIASLKAQRHPPEQILVIIDHNKQLLWRALFALPSDVDVLASSEQSGLSGARNTGIRFARGEVIAFLDDDAEADPEWLDELLANYLPHVAGAGGLVVPVWPDGQRPRWLPPEFDWVVGCSYRGLPDTVAPQRNPIGAAMSFRRTVFDEVGVFDTDMGRIGSTPLGCEETELSLRVRRNLVGAELMHVPLAVVHHHMAPERTRLRYFVKRCYAEGISKSAVAKRAGKERGLSSERQYVRSTLPRGVGDGLRAGVRGDLGGFARAVMIGVGLIATILGYLRAQAIGAPVRSKDESVATTETKERRRLISTFGYLVSKQGATAAIGLVYWSVATHLFPAQDVGLAASASSTAFFLAAIGVLGIAVLLLAELGSVEESMRRSVFTTGMAVACLVVLVLSLGTMAISPLLGKSLRIIGHEPVTAALFVVGGVATVATIVFDNAAIGLDRGSAQLTRGIVASLLKLGIVGCFVFVGSRTSAGLIFSWVAGLVVSLVVCAPMLRLGHAGHGTGALRRRIELIRRYGMLSLNHHALNLSINSVSFIVPAIAALLIVPEQVAYFITADLIATTILIIPYLLALALFAAKSDDPYVLHHLLRRTLPLGLAACGAIVIGVELLAPEILRFFGPAYALHGSTPLRLLILIGPSYVIKDHYVAIRRAQGRLSDATKTIAIGTAAEAAGAAIGGALWGATGLCLGWAIAAACEAAVLAPAVIRVYLRPQVVEPDPGEPSSNGHDRNQGPGIVLASTLSTERSPRRADPMPQEHAARPAPAPGGSRLGSVLAVVGVGLLTAGSGDALARTGHQGPVVALFCLGLVAVVTPCAWRLTGSAAKRTERLWVCVVLGLGLLACYIMRSPLIFDGFDELAHGATLVRMLDGRSLFPTNNVLPVSPYYPGIESATIAVKWITGLPLLLDQMVVLVASRLVLVLGVFLIVERVCRSSRAGGIGVLVYAASPEFYSQGAQYGYETIAVSFAVAVVYLVLVSIDTPRPRMGRLFALSLLCIGAMVLSHHVTTWITIAFLVIWAAGLRFLVERPAGRPTRQGTLGSERVEFYGRARPLARSHQGQTAKRKQQALVVAIAALVGLVTGGLWTGFVGRRLTQYVGPIAQAAATSVSSTVSQLHGSRQLFQNSAGGGSPGWEILIMLAAAVLTCAILLVSLYGVIWKRRGVRGGKLRYLPAVVAATYPLTLLSNVSDDAKLVGARATTFIFFGVAVVVAGWLAGRLSVDRRSIERLGTIAVATVCFLGSTLYGGGPLPAFVPGPYLVGAHERSLGAPSLAAANWVAANIPAGTTIAADRDNGALLNDIGHVNPVTSTGGSVDPAPLFFGHDVATVFGNELAPSEIALIRKANIRYVLVDTRLSEGLPLYGAYISPGESGPASRLTISELEKFDSIPGIQRIYDNGAIQIYDLSSLIGRPPIGRTGRSLESPGESGTDVGILLLAILVTAVWLLRLRRRGRFVRVDAHMVFCGLVGAMVIGLFGALAIILLHLPPGPVAVVTLAGLLVLGIWPALRRDRSPGSRHRWAAPPSGPAVSALGPDETQGTHVSSSVESIGSVCTASGRGTSSSKGPVRRSRPQLALALVGVVLAVLGATVATATATKEWVPPLELSVVTGQGGARVVDVELGSAGPVSAQIVAVSGSTFWSAPLARTSSAQHVVLPASLASRGALVYLVSGGHALRVVDG